MNKITYFLYIFIFLLPAGLRAQSPDITFQVPELAGTFRLGLIRNSESSWLNTAKVKSKQEGPYTIYTIKNSLTGKGKLTIQVRPLKDTEGSVLQIEPHELPQGTLLCWGFGGSGGRKITTPTIPSILPEHCKDNVFSIEGHAFTVYYGTSRSLKIFSGITPLNSVIYLSDAHRQSTPLEYLHSGKKTDAPALAAQCPLENGKAIYFCFYKQNPKADYNYYMLPELFKQGSIQKQTTGEWMKSTPD